MSTVQLIKVAVPVNSSVKNFSEERIYIATGDLDKSKINIDEADRVTFANKPSRANQETQIDDVIFAKMQATDKSILIDAENSKYIYSSGFFILRPTKDILPKYLYYFLRSKSFHSQKDKNCSGATQKAITLDGLKKIQIPLPPISDQQSIIKKLNKIVHLMELKEESIRKTEELTKSIFLEMFGDISVNQKHWDIKKLDELKIDKHGIVDGPFGSSISTKRDYVDHGTVPVVRTKNVGIFKFKEEDLKFITEEKFESIKRSEVLPGDIILTKVGTIGNLCFFPENYQKGVLSTTGSCRIRVNPLICTSQYLLYYLYLYRGIMESFVVTGVQPFLNMTHIKNFDILMPNIKLQEKFSEIFKINNLLLIDQNQALQKLQELYDTTTQEIFSF